MKLTFTGFLLGALLLGPSLAKASETFLAYRPNNLDERLLWAIRLQSTREVQTALWRGADPAKRDDKGINALYEACREGKPEIISLLVESGAPVNEAAGYGDFPINLAAGQGHLDAVKLLLSLGAELEQAGQYGGRPLNNAACGGSLATVTYLLNQGAEIDAYDFYFRSALTHAALFDRPGEHRYQSIIRCLLDAGANPNLGAGQFDPPLSYALLQARPSTLELLLNHGADPNQENSWGLTALHFAGKYGNREAVPILLAHGARVEDIFQAAVTDNVAIAGKLLRGGENVEVKDWEGQSPLDWAVAMGSERVAAMLINQPALSGVTDEEAQKALTAAVRKSDHRLITKLLEAFRSRGDFTMPADALCAAASAGNVTVMCTLLDAGVEVDSCDSKGRTALHCAALEGRIVALETLIGRGANVNETDLAGCTPLHLAAGNHQLEAVRILIGSGAVVEARDSTGQTPLHAVCLSWQGAISYNVDYETEIDIAKSLLEAGADINALDNDAHSPLDLTNSTNGCGYGVPGDLQYFMVQHGASLSYKWRSDHHITAEEYAAQIARFLDEHEEAKDLPEQAN